MKSAVSQTLPLSYLDFPLNFHFLLTILSYHQVQRHWCNCELSKVGLDSFSWLIMIKSINNDKMYKLFLLFFISFYSFFSLCYCNIVIMTGVFTHAWLWYSHVLVVFVHAGVVLIHVAEVLFYFSFSCGACWALYSLFLNYLSLGAIYVMTHGSLLDVGLYRVLRIELRLVMCKVRILLYYCSGPILFIWSTCYGSGPCRGSLQCSHKSLTRDALFFFFFAGVLAYLFVVVHTGVATLFVAFHTLAEFGFSSLVGSGDHRWQSF